jgi:eukaryotic-like serine/threonine-protein kinase
MQDIQTTLPTGFIVQKRYKIEELLGKGGFGAVYLVRDLRMKSNVFALKELLDSTAAMHSALTREGKMLQQLDHPSLPRVYYTFRDETLHRSYILMDYIPGPNLEEIRKGEPGQRLELKRILQIMAPVFDAVSYLHALKPPIIHRDIKPANIIVPPEGEHTVLVDFGIAKEYDMEGTTTAIRLCSPGYGAPEQYASGTNLRTDIYGLGATLYALLTGVIPTDAFIRLTQAETRHVEALKPVSAYVENIPPSIDAIIQRAMALHSDDRFATVEEFWQALDSSANVSDISTVVEMAPLAVPTQDTDHEDNVSQVDKIDTKVPPASLAPIQTTIRKNPTSRKRRFPLLLLLVAGLFLLGGSVGAFFYLSANNGHGSSISRAHTTSPARKVTSGSTPHPTVATTPSPTSTAITTTTADNPPPASSSYPVLQSGYNGNISDKYTTPPSNSTMTLSRIVQNGANISGSFAVAAPLEASDSFTGIVTTDNKIEFTVPSYAGLAPLLFTGQIQSDGSMVGTYCSYRSNNQCDESAGGWGDWNARPNSIGGGGGSSFIEGDYARRSNPS